MAIDTPTPPRGRTSRHPAQRAPHSGKPTGHPVHQLQRHQTPAPNGRAQKVMSRGGRKRITKQHVNECPCCDGWGYIPALAPVIENDDEGRPVTISFGMGCEHCLGVGRLTHPPHRNKPERTVGFRYNAKNANWDLAAPRVPAYDIYAPAKHIAFSLPLDPVTEELRELLSGGAK